MRNRQVVFDEIFSKIEAGVEVPVSLSEEAHKHGIQVDSIDRLFYVLNSDGDDSDDEPI